VTTSPLTKLSIHDRLLLFASIIAGVRHDEIDALAGRVNDVAIALAKEYVIQS